MGTIHSFWLRFYEQHTQHNGPATEHEEHLMLMSFYAANSMLLRHMAYVESVMSDSTRINMAKDLEAEIQLVAEKNMQWELH